MLGLGSCCSVCVYFTTFLIWIVESNCCLHLTLLYGCLALISALLIYYLLPYDMQHGEELLHLNLVRSLQV